MGKKYLKRQNAVTITIFLVWSISLFVVLCSNIGDFWADMLARVGDLKARDSLFCFLLLELLLATIHCPDTLLRCAILLF